MDWPHLSWRVVARGLTLCLALPLALSFAMQCEQVADVLAEVPESSDRNVAREVDCVGCCGNLENELAAAVQFADQSFAVEKKRVGQFFGRMLIGCHCGEVRGRYGRVSTRKMFTLFTFLLGGVALLLLWRFVITRENIVGFVDSIA
jgi:hypothetical protein